MRPIRLSAQLLGILALLVVGSLLVAEATDQANGRWRTELADVIETVATPTWPAWTSAIVGVALAAVGVFIIGAQLAPPKRGLNVMHEVHRAPDGETRIRGRATIAAVRHELEAITGVVSASATLEKKRIRSEVKVDDRADVVEIEAEARRRLGHEFWINLGLADLTFDLTIVHHPNPPRVR